MSSLELTSSIARTSGFIALMSIIAAFAFGASLITSVCLPTSNWATPSLTAAISPRSSATDTRLPLSEITLTNSRRQVVLPQPGGEAIKMSVRPFRFISLSSFAATPRISFGILSDNELRSLMPQTVPARIIAFPHIPRRIPPSTFM